MQTRVHKLLILVGEEGEELQSRDYKKLSDVIVGEYLQESTPEVKDFFAEFIPKVARSVPLKAHFYAGLTADISRQQTDLAGRVIEAQLQHLQADLGACKFSEALNSLNFLSEAMNISFFNSLTLMNLFEDILLTLEKQQGAIRKGLAQLLTRALPLCARSLHEKTSHEFRKFMERLRKVADGDELAEYLYSQFSKNSIRDYSAIGRLGADFSGVGQIQCKFKLHLDLKPMRGKEISLAEYYRLERRGNGGDFLEYRRTEGVIYRSQVQLLVDSFEKNAAILQLKLTNLVKAHSDANFVRNLVESLVLRGLKAKHGVAVFSLLVKLKNDAVSQHLPRSLQDLMCDLFLAGEEFELSLLLSFARLFSFLLSNWKEEFDWTRFLHEEEGFVKRRVLLRLILEELSLLNDKFICPTQLQAYEPPKPATSEEEYATTQDMETFQNFEALLKAKTEAAGVMGSIDSEHKYEIFLEALFRRTSNSQTHLHILQGRYHQILVKFSEWDWDLINKIRNFFRNSFFHRLLYLRFLIRREVIRFASYVNYVGSLKNKTDLEMIWIRMQLNELNAEFGKTLRKQ